jgi:aspartyl-tRNA(Asn)/glutamyl-tRNA(Gln) amidotransferase subunit A
MTKTRFLFLCELLNQRFEDIRRALDRRLVTSQELTQACLLKLQESQSDLNSAILIFQKSAIESAIEADKKLDAGESGRLLGVPIAIKDNILVDDSVTTAGSKFLETFVSPYDATVVSAIKKAGGVIVAKLNLDEFGMGSSSENSAYGPVSNPWNLKFVAGGSSGGSAAALAARMVPLTLGTDTGGSIRQPASFCNVVGLKPTYGQVSRLGVVAYASSLDQVGPLANDTGGIAAIMDEIVVPDSLDSTNNVKKNTDINYSQSLKKFQENPSVRGVKIGVPDFLFLSQGVDKSISAKVRHALEKLTEQGAELLNVELPHLKYSIPAYYLIATSEASSNLSRYNGIHCGRPVEYSPNIERNLHALISESRAAGFGSEVKKRILLGTFALSSGFIEAYYKKASQLRRLIFNDFKTAFESCDFIVTPTSAVPVFEKGEKTADPVAMYFADLCTLGVNLAGLPAASVPCGFDEIKMPVGMQIIAPWNHEEKLLQVMSVVEQLFPDSAQIPDYVARLNQRVSEKLEGQSV